MGDRTLKILFVSLGCDKNLVDSEHMLGMLAGGGYEITDFEEEADIIIINTCCFIESAKEESIDTILELAKYRTDGKCRALIVTGCMAERYRQEVMEEIPEVDAILGTNSGDAIQETITRVLNGEKAMVFHPLDTVSENGHRVMTTTGHYEYLKIAEGCDKNCTYCIIPSLRGHYRSVPMEQLVAEARQMASDGVRELNLVAQETTLYGVDLYGRKSLHVLLRKLCAIEGIHWIHILYCYPEEIYPELIQTMKEEPKICHYLDLPIQHASDAILRRMNRRTDKKELIDIVTNLRREIPDISLRTTLLSGFPGETEEQHQELLDFIRQMKFERLGVFSYSREEGTPAADFADQVPEEIKERRRDELMTAQQEIAFAAGRALIGESREVFVEGFMDKDQVYVGRTYADAPGVDGLIFVDAGGVVLHSGDFVKARISSAVGYDLKGELKNEFTK